MSSCSKCEGFRVRLYFWTPREYAGLARQLDEIVSQGTFEILHADLPLSSIAKEVWDGGDLIVHRFRCNRCGRRFELSADTYHGGARWVCIDES